MKSLFRTLMIAAVAGLTVVALAPAQSPNESAPGPVREPPSVQPVEPQYYQEIAQQYLELAANDPYNADSRFSRPSSTRSSLSRRKVFIIPSAEIDRDSHLAIERDIHVMSHIFDRILKKPVDKIGGLFTVMDDFFGRDSRVTQVIYMDGYGVLFFMDVDFALVGPPQPPQPEEPNEPKEQVDTTWKQAERELYAPPGIAAYKSIEGRSRPQYEGEKVELLKKNLVETLKHAANIRALKSDDSVILTIVGRAITPTALIRRGKKVEWEFLKSGKWVPAGEDAGVVTYPSLPPSVLTIRAKKSDIDAFSKGELDFDAFYERTQLLANWSGTAGAMVDGKYWQPPMRR
ncbi:MAG: hypothetical protein JSW59_13245 [Phycisphaerales bacterium]|nr:MAG: hypothetical protein JSW59_13245 [Phycisphaerales bacterium]